MNDGSLHNFYEHAVLPQFGLNKTDCSWSGSQKIGPDEIVHYFSVDEDEYALIFEDAGGLGKSDTYIRENVLENRSSYTFMEPIAATNSTPSYDGLRLPAPYQYCENVTGTFTLIKLLS